jgi:hypothetical protein
VMSRIEVLGYPQIADQLHQAMRLLGYSDTLMKSHSASPWCSAQLSYANSTAYDCQTH